MDKVKQLINESNHDLTDMSIKTGSVVGLNFAAMSINDWMGFIVAFLTAIYMILQIESVWQKRKEARARKKVLKDDL